MGGSFVAVGLAVRIHPTPIAALKPGGNTGETIKPLESESTPRR